VLVDGRDLRPFIVIGLDADVVAIRFRDDGSERRLVLGYAPLERL